MKFNCGPSFSERCEARHKRLHDWHPFFCLLPRRIGPGDCRWLETIERKGKFHSYFGAGGYSAWWTWEYRA